MGWQGRQNREDEIRPSRRKSSGANVQSKRVMITSQNHGSRWMRRPCQAYSRDACVAVRRQPARFELTDKPAFCFQGHPEASPGPHDMAGLFDRFVAMMQERKTG